MAHDLMLQCGHGHTCPKQNAKSSRMGSATLGQNGARGWSYAHTMLSFNFGMNSKNLDMVQADVLLKCMKKRYRKTMWDASPIV